MLLAKGARRDRKDNNGLTPLAWFARSLRAGSDDEHMFDLLAAGIDIDESDNSDHTPLFYAARSGNVETVRLLLGRGALHDWPSSWPTPLLWAETVRSERKGEDITKWRY